MWMGRRREQWDMVSVLQHTLMHSFGKPKHKITPEDLNPIRQAEKQEEDEDDELFEEIDEVLRNGISK